MESMENPAWIVMVTGFYRVFMGRFYSWLLLTGTHVILNDFLETLGNGKKTSQVTSSLHHLEGFGLNHQPDRVSRCFKEMWLPEWMNQSWVEQGHFIVDFQQQKHGGSSPVGFFR